MSLSNTQDSISCTLRFLIHYIQVQGIKGTYIANIEVEHGAYGATVISFDKGAEWVRLTAPTLDQHGVPLNCFPVSYMTYVKLAYTPVCLIIN